MSIRENIRLIARTPWFKCLEPFETGLIYDKFLREMILEKSVLGYSHGHSPNAALVMHIKEKLPK